MSRLVAFAAIIVTAALGFLDLVYFRLETLLVPPDDAVVAVGHAVAGAIAILMVVALRMASRDALRGTACILAAILVASFLPRALYAAERHLAERSDRVEGAALEAGLVDALEARRSDVAARVAAKRAYAPEAAFDFVMMVEDADLTWRGFSDHSPEALALLDAALEGGVLDPNVRPPGGVPLFIRLYNVRIKPTAPRLVEKRDWEIEKHLVTHGADLADPAAAELKANLARKETPGPGRFLALEQ